MRSDPLLHNRHSIRLQGYDYSQAGAYYVTMCAWQRRSLFGAIKGGIMCPNGLGALIESEWNRIPEHAAAELDAFVLMPNHLHGIIVLVGAGQRPAPTAARFGHVPTGSLGVVVGQFKSRVTKQVMRLWPAWGHPIWQRNYYEHVIRNEKEWNSIRNYVGGNPIQWEADREFHYYHPERETRP
jgi:REP element-mobilizing transposase RayT